VGRTTYLLAVGLVLLILLSSLLVSAVYGVWGCATDKVFPSLPTPDVSVTGSAKVVDQFWWEPVFTSHNVQGWYKAYYLLWEWSGRDAKVSMNLNVTGSLKGLSGQIIRESEVRLLINMHSDRGYAESTFALVIKPEQYEIMKKLGLEEFISNLSTSLLYSGLPLIAVDAYGALIYELALSLGFTALKKELLMPIYVKATSTISKSLELVREFGFLDSLLLSNWYLYQPVWSFKYEDDSACSGCIFWWCWGCQNVRRPSVSIGFALMVDPETISQYSITVGRIITIVKEETGERAFITTFVGRPINTTVEITVPPDAQVINMTYKDRVLTLIRRELTGGRYPVLSLRPEDVGIKVRVEGVESIDFPQPRGFVYSYSLSKIFGRDTYESSAIETNGNLTTLTIVIQVGEKPKPTIQTDIGLVALTLASATAIISIPLLVRHTFESLKKRRRFVKRRAPSS